MDDVVELVRELYRVVDALEDRFPGRHFTPDGHLVGSLGEALAANAFGLELVAASTEGYDAVAPDGRRVEIKATQGHRVALQADVEHPNHIIVLRLDRRSGKASVVYNGPASPVWEAAGPRQKNGQRAVSLARLRGLMEGLDLRAMLPQVGTLS